MSVCCPSVISGCLVEIIKEDDCGNPLVGGAYTNNMIRTAGLISISLTPDIEQGNTITERNMCGDLCVNERECPILKGFNGKMRMCAIDSALLNMTLGVSPILDTDLNIIGGSMKGESRSICNNFSLKIWGKTTSKCSDGKSPWVVYSFPRITDPVLSSEIAFQNNTLQTWEIDFYARESSSTWVDPAGIFTNDEVQSTLFAWKCTDTMPSPTASCAFGTV